eukprot:Colp12_sorted_trinity150504_noHs@25985
MSAERKRTRSGGELGRELEGIKRQSRVVREEATREISSSRDAIPESDLPTFKEVSTAAFRIRGGIVRTACEKAHDTMIELSGMELYFKKDFLLTTGSFKERGARNALMLLTDEQKKTGVVAASAGNHALALAFHGRQLNVPITVVMPMNAPMVKVSRCKAYGATVILHGDHIGMAKEHAMTLVTAKGLTYINGYDHPNIIAGAGTMGLEIMEQMEQFDAVVVPIGGGGLIAGVALAVKTLRPDVQVIGVEPERCASYTAALEAGKPVVAAIQPTLADGLAVPCVGENAFAVARNLVDKVVLVKEKHIALALLKAVECEKCVLEGGGVAGLAACLAGVLPELKGKKVVVPLCGANIDTTVLGRCLERGLAADGRLCRFACTVPDRPGGVATLCKLMAECGVSIKDIFHERAWLESDIFSVQVKCVVETRDQEHAEWFRQKLLGAGYTVVWGGQMAM